MQKSENFCTRKAVLYASKQINWLQVMRTSVMIFMGVALTVNLLIASPGRAQGDADKTISLKYQNTALITIIKAIEEKADIIIMYELTPAIEEQKISISVKNRTVEEILDLLVSGKNLKWSFKASDNVFRIEEASEAGSTGGAESKSTLNLPPPPITISGRVVDENGEPLAGVNVVVKGTSAGTTSDSQGNFSLNIADNSGTLVFSYVGYTTVEQNVTASSNYLSIVLQITDASSEEVIIVGYGTQKRVNLTGAVSTVDAKRIENRPITNLGQGLQGLIPNLNITIDDGAAGSGASFNVRGFTSTNGGSPLILVDGVVMDPNLINPSEVESVSVLKDASSASLYGSRAAFGVVLITTKKGKKSKPIIELTSNYSMNRPTDIPDLVDSKQYLEFREEKARNLGTAAPFSEETKNLILAHYNDPANNPSARVNPNNPRSYQYFGNTDWFRTIMKDNNPLLQSNLSVRGGSENISYYFSGGAFNQAGILKYGNDSYDRYNLRGKVDIDVNRWLQLNINTVFTHTRQDNVYNYSGIGTLWHDLTRKDVFIPLLNPDGTDTESPLALLKNGGRDKKYISDSWITLGSVLTPFPGLKITGNYSFNSYNYNRSEHKKLVERYQGPSDMAGANTVHTTPTALYLGNQRDQYYAINIYGEYEKEFLNKHAFKATVGFNEEKKSFDNTSSSNINLLSDLLPSLNLATGTPTASQSKTAWALQGYFARINYAFDERYLLELNGRYDATSRFPKADRWALFPSVSAGWRVSNERFFQLLKPIFSEVKIRGSYGELGNQALTNNFPYLATLNSFRPAVILSGDRPLSVAVPSLVSSILTWETAISSNIGIDISMLSSKLQFSFDYFDRKVIDQLGPSMAMPATLGTSAPQANAVESVTKGWEFEVNWNDKIGNVSYYAGFRLADAQGQITNYNNAEKSLSTYYIGQKIGEIWGYQTNGLFKSRDEYLKSGLDYSNLTGLQIEGGDVHYVDQDKNGVINPGLSTLNNPGDRVVIGNSTPRYTYGINLGAQWKQFAVDVFMQGVGKRDLSLSGGSFWPDESGTPQVHHLDYWSENNPDAYWPRVLGSQGGFNYQTTDRYLQNFSYLRMKQLSVSYALSSSLTKRLSLKGLKIFFAGQNLFEIDNILPGFDPEITPGGFNGWGSGKSYPFARSYSFGINLSF